MKKLTFISVLITTIFFLNVVNGQTLKTGTTAAQVLKFNVGPRAIGMGGAYTSVSNDILSTYWNPAGTAAINSNEVFFNHTDLYLDIKHDYSAFATNLTDLGTVGLFVSVLSMDEMEVRTIDKPEGTGEFFDAGALVIGVNYARNLTENFSIGFNFKYINESIWHMSANGFAVDIGTLYKIPILNEFRIAASISNFGTKMQLSGRDVTKTYASGSTGRDILNVNLELDQFDLPLLFRFGVSADVVKDESSRLTLGVDAVHPNDHSEYINSGLEYSWNETFFIRGGYNSLFEVDSEKGLTVGAGVNYRLMDIIKIKLDYAYQDFGRLTSIQYFSVGITF
ncbi:MAG: PorV/PorQ family protein [Ignavibacterium album]|uniref:PorV/PorQ family protein n=1 Tax=Ignavibacterium album TaxID=591197 RepID=UPI0026ED1427|nr:PorV/PorQ family protein [Ignavibacterium album]MBI5661906.1 PorV/PorQ family protein [Ignavibacterium album]